MSSTLFFLNASGSASFNELRFCWGCLPLRLSSIEVVLCWVHLPLKSSFIYGVFHLGCLPLTLSYIEVSFIKVVFYLYFLPFRWSWILVDFHYIAALFFRLSTSAEWGFKFEQNVFWKPNKEKSYFRTLLFYSILFAQTIANQNSGNG